MSDKLTPIETGELDQKSNKENTVLIEAITGQVNLSFDKPVKFLEMTPDKALAFAKEITKQAKLASKKNGETFTL